MASKLAALRDRFELQDEATQGEWLPLVDIYKDPLGLAVKVVSIDTDKYIKARTKALGKYAKKSQKWREDNLQDIIAAFMAKEVVIDWKSYDPDGNEPDWLGDVPPDADPYDAEEMAALFTHKPKVGRNTTLEQVDFFASDALNFRLEPDPGKSKTTSGSA